MEPVTTRRVSKADVAALKELQLSLAREGIHVSQQDLFSRMVEFVNEHATAFAKRLRGKPKDSMERWLELSFPAVGPKTNAVKDVDVTL